MTPKSRLAFISLLLVGAILLPSCRAGESSSSNSVCFVASSDVDPKLAIKVAEEIGSSLRFKYECITNSSSIDKAGDSKSVLKELQSLRKGGCSCAIAIFSQGDDKNLVSAISSDDGVAAVNIWELSDPPGKGAVSMHRAVKEATRALGHALGLDDCPFPACAMKPAFSLQELDRTSRGPCPPCRMKIMQRLKELGCALPEPSPEDN